MLKQNDERKKEHENMKGTKINKNYETRNYSFICLCSHIKQLCDDDKM